MQPAAQPQHHNNTYSNWFSWLGWLSYSFQRVSLANVHTRLLYLSGVSMANVLVGAVLYRFVSGKAFSACLVKTYAVLFRAPGVGVFNEDTLAASLVLNLMFIFGLFVFACLLGMITDEIKLQLHAIRAGEVKLPLRDHVVVLNWNRQALSILKQLSHAQADSHSRLYKRPIVVLAEPSKGVLDAAVAAVFKGSNRHQLRLFCRSGQPSKARDLERVAAEAAHAVILLHPEGTSKAAADALKAQALISLTCLREQVLGQDPAAAQASSTGTALRLLRCVSAAARAACRGSTAVLSRLRLAASRSSGRSRTSSFGRSSSHHSDDSSRSMRIVVQTGGSQPCGQQHEPDVIGFLQEATASSLHNSSIQQVQLLSQSTLDRLVCQTAVEPGVATVFRELVRVGGDVHLEWCEVGEQLAGSYSSAAGMLQDCVLLGVLEGESKSLTLNPPDHLLLQPGDRLVALTRQGILNTSSPATSTRKPQHPAVLKRTVSRMSSMASPQLAGLTTTHHSRNGSGSSSGCTSPTAASRAVASAAKPGSSSQGQRIVVLGWTEAAVPELLLQLQEALPLGSNVTVLLPLPPAGTPTAQQQQQQKQVPVNPTAPQVQYVRVADPGSVQALLGAGVADADAVMLGPALSAKAAPGSIEADALVTSTVLAVQQALQTVSGGVAAGPMSHPIPAPRSHLGAGWQQEQRQQQQRSKLHVVAVVSSYSVRRALQTFLSFVLLGVNFSYEICLMEEFAAGMLVSVALEVANSLVIDQLLLNPRSGGLGIWSLHKLGLTAADAGSQQLTWSDVSQAARQCRCTALGYRRADGRMVLVPSASATLSVGDRVVVLEGSSSRGSRGGGGSTALWK